MSSSTSAQPMPSPGHLSPSSIRTYFSILTEHYSIPASDVEKCVSCWKYGKDAEVLYYDCETYRAIFGDEIGAISFRWKKDYIQNCVGEEIGWEERGGGDIAVTLAAGSAVFFFVAWMLSGVWEAMIMLAASGLFFAGGSAWGFGKMVQGNGIEAKAEEEAKNR
ncbi:hypothetical protein DL98DRAFT_527996 [Cadophora sp. DSE1049]|nr:hypothetical protein DL98DRAFT_527996 [Cadophora sp. DSE1049]